MSAPAETTAGHLIPNQIPTALIAQRNDLNQLNQSLARANAEAAELLTDLEEKNETLKDTNRQLARANAHAAELMAKIELLDEKIHRLNRALSEANALAAELAAKLEINQEELLKAKSKLEEQYAQLQGLEAMRDSLTHIIVHDMRNPLTGISGTFSTLKLLLEGRLDETETEVINQALESSSALLEMIYSLLDISRLESGKMPLHIKTVDMRTHVEKAVEMLGALAKEAAITRAMPRAPVFVPCDPDLIRREIANLVENAIHFTPPEYHEMIFEKFGQVEMHRERKMCSSGLGPTFCKLAVEAQSGRIGVENTVGEWSSFWVFMPIPPDPGK